MPKQLFVSLDPRVLERYTQRKIPRRRRLSQDKLIQLTLLKRALQSLPPRELQMLYAVKVQGVEQDEACKIFHVRQSNISYRLERTDYRIRLHNQLMTLASETQLRRKLFSLGMCNQNVSAVAGVMRTTSQSATAETLGISQGTVRSIYAKALSKLSNSPNCENELRLLMTVERNYNQLRAIATQCRWSWKVGGQNYTESADSKESS